MTKKCRKIGKITNFQFWISRPIWPILMICELHKMSMTFFMDNPRYWKKNPRIRQNIAFFEVRCHFGAGLRNFDREIFGKKTYDVC